MSRTEINTILRAVAEKHGCTMPDIRGSERRRSIVAARREAAAILRGRGLSYSDIGKALGGKHHTSVICLLDGRSKTITLPPEADIEAIRLRALQAKSYIDSLIAEIDRQIRGAA